MIHLLYGPLMLGIASSLTSSMQARGHTQFPGSHPVSLNRFYLFEPLKLLIYYINLINRTFNTGLLFLLPPHVLHCVVLNQTIVLCIVLVMCIFLLSILFSLTFYLQQG